jgi:hypothetical protein
VINAWTWARELKPDDAPRPGVLESVRWVESYERIAEHACELPDTRHVCIGDRESDILELLVKARDMGHAADYLVRCRHNRVLPDGGKLWERVMGSVPLGLVRFEMPAGRGRRARQVEQEVRVQCVALSDQKGGQLEVSCLIASEVNAPAGAKPVVWRLLSNRMAPTLQAAVELIDWYRARWEIELFFLVLKEGCRVERLQLGDSDRLQTALALYMVIAWRINRLMRLGRTLPDLPTGLLFEPEEWRAAFILNKKPVPKQVPALNTVVRLIAQRGGLSGQKARWRAGGQEFVAGHAGDRHLRRRCPLCATVQRSHDLCVRGCVKRGNLARLAGFDVRVDQVSHVRFKRLQVQRLITGLADDLADGKVLVQLGLDGFGVGFAVPGRGHFISHICIRPQQRHDALVESHALRFMGFEVVCNFRVAAEVMDVI